MLVTTFIVDGGFVVTLVELTVVKSVVSLAAVVSLLDLDEVVDGVVVRIDDDV